MACKGGSCGRRKGKAWNPTPTPTGSVHGPRGAAAGANRSPVYSPASQPVANPTTLQQTLQNAPAAPEKAWWDPLGLFSGTGATPTPQQQAIINANPNIPSGPISTPLPGDPGFWAGLKRFALGREPEFLQFSPYTPNQQSAMQQLLQTGLGGLSPQNISFEPIEQRARQQFQENTIPSLAERFNALSGGQGLRSSAFQTALGRQASDLESSLAALRSQHNINLLPAYQNMATMGLTPQYESIYAPGGPGAVHAAGRAIGQLIPIGGKALANYYFPGS